MAGYDSMNTLFSSLGGVSSSSGSSDMLGISYSDYASIKNGSYRKLVSAYYSNAEKEEGISSLPSNIKDSKSKLNSINELAGNLKDSASKLLNKGKGSLFQTKVDEKGHSYVDYDEDKVYSAVKDFVKDYNDLLDSASEADTLTFLRATKNMVSYAKANENALSAIGITIGSDNKLSVDEDKFKEASKARVQSVLQSNGGFVYQINAKASTIANYASDMSKRVSDSSNRTSNTGKTSTSTSKDTSKTLAAIEDAADAAKSSLSKLRTTGTKSLFNKVTQTGTDGTTTMDYDRDGIYKAVKSFLKDYNTLLDKTEDSDTSSIIQARKTMINYVAANKTKLASMGIKIDSDNELSIDETKFKEADMDKVRTLFQGTASLGAEIENQITKIHNYAEKEASKSNTYNDNGSYTYNYNNGDLYNSFM